MSLSSSTIATLLIAGTAIGGSTAAVLVTNAPVEANQQNQLQVLQPNTSVPGQSQKLTVDGKVTTIDPGAVKSSVVTPDPSTTTSPITPVDPKPPVDPMPPVPGFGGGSNGDDNGDDNGSGDDDNHSNYSNGGNHHHGDDGDDDNEGSDD